MLTFNDLKEKISYLNQNDQKLVEKAYFFAEKNHADQKRNTGEPYIQHPLHTAIDIAKLKMDARAISAALLHDLCEDTPCDIAQIKKEFGREIADLVNGVTKLGKIRITKRWLFMIEKEDLPEFDRQIETLRKMFLAMARDIRIVIIKLYDRLHNMQTIEGIPEEKRLRMAKETIEIYAPLAYRLGMGELKGQLEDLAFPYIYPKEYKELKEKVKKKLTAKEQYIEKLKKILYKKLYKEGIKAEIHGRTKHMYSLFLKLKRYDNDLERIYDLVALRIIVDTVSDCYKTLGILHQMWKPLVGRIKDYVAMTKPNGYSSIHTTVFAANGEIVEIQIRTKEMHKQAEYGIAAGWNYSEKKGTLDYIKRISSRTPGKDLAWVQELAKWQKAQNDNKAIFQGLGMDFFSRRIFVYTPTGDVEDLPVGATPIDFAYAIHTDLGNHIGGAKVNNKMVDFSYQLQSGDIVEVIKKKNASPKSDWLEFAKTSLARGKIKSAIKRK